VNLPYLAMEWLRSGGLCPKKAAVDVAQEVSKVFVQYLSAIRRLLFIEK